MTARRAVPSGPPAVDGDVAGFILLDLVLAMAILAAIAALAWPLLPRSTSPARLTAYAEEVGSMLAESRIAAARRATRIETRIDPRARLVAEGARGRIVRLPPDVIVDAVTTDACMEENGVVVLGFATDGRSCGLKLSLSLPRHRAIVEVDWLTGGVTVRGGGRG